MSALAVTPQTEVREIAAAYPEALRMLEALGIDYCCGGKRPLSEAAVQAGVPVETAVAVLQAAIVQAAGAERPARNWLEAPLGELMDHIVRTHHTYMHSELPRLEAIVDLVARVHGPNHGNVLEPLKERYGALKTELQAHLAKEEDITFPGISRLVDGECSARVVETIAELGEEHDAAGEVLGQMRAVTAGYAVPEDACGTYRALYDGLQAMERDIHQHIHLENNILFPRALELARACGRPA